MGRRRGRSPHPGVVLLKRLLPSGLVAWRGRFRDPDSGKWIYETIDSTVHTNADGRKEWANAKSAEVTSRRREIDLGIPKHSSMTLKEAVEDYLEGSKRLRPATLHSYGATLRILLQWAGGQGVVRVKDLTPPVLAGFRQHLASRHRAVPASGQKRGARKSDNRILSPTSVNHYLRDTKSFANAQRVRGRIPAATRDGISEALKCLRVDREAPRYLKPKECVALLRAALKHDAALSRAEVRAEFAGTVAGKRPARPRYGPIAPFTAFVLLSGCRLGEALAVRWVDVDLDARDEDGAVVGEILLAATAVKTHDARRVDLVVSPALCRLLQALKIRRGESKYVFGGDGPMGSAAAKFARKRLLENHGAPEFGWQRLRKTCACYLTNAFSIFGAGSIYRSAMQLGHSVEVATKYYLHVIRGIPREARDLETAMGIVEDMVKVEAAARGESVQLDEDPRPIADAATGTGREPARTVRQAPAESPHTALAGA